MRPGLRFATILLCGVLPWKAPAHAQGTAAGAEDALQWSVTRGKGTARLTYGVPRTDRALTLATCRAGRTGRNGAADGVTDGVTDGAEAASRFVFAFDTGARPAGETVALRFSGGGRETEVTGRVVAPAGGATGVAVALAHDHALWAKLVSEPRIGYGVPGHVSVALPLAAGHGAIRDYLAACRSLGEAVPVVASGDAGSRPDPAGTPPEAPLAALDMSVPAGRWTAETGPTADGGTMTSASVRGRGAVVYAACGPSETLELALGETAPGAFAQFETRVERARKAGTPVTMQFDDGARHDFPAALVRRGGVTGLLWRLKPDGAAARALVTRRSFTVSQAPFGAAFALTGSKEALCEAASACGMALAGCPGSATATAEETAPAPAAPVARRRGARCRSRSVYVEGRGCVLRRYAKRLRGRTAGSAATSTRRRDTRCKSRSVWIEGRGCVRRRSANKRRNAARTSRNVSGRDAAKRRATFWTRGTSKRRLPGRSDSGR